MNKPKFNLLSVFGITTGVIVIIATAVYLFTDKMIPGLIPFCTAVMLVPMWLQQKQSKAVSILFITAAVLNVIAGIIQIITALIP